MSQALIVITYANSRIHPLSKLGEEYEKVHTYLQARAAVSSALRPYPLLESGASREEICEVLTTDFNRDELELLAYGGHAGQDYLVTENETTRSQGVAVLLSQCPRLQLVVLNGCSTLGQVRRIFEECTKCGKVPPVVVATTAKVGDEAAKDFGVTFFKYFFLYNSTIRQAFDTAIGVVQTRIAIEVDEANDRGAIRLGNETGTWGLYTLETGQDRDRRLDWSLLPAPAQRAPFDPNKYLFTQLIYGLTTYVPSIQVLLDTEPYQDIQDVARYDDILLKSFPHPISVQLRKLRAIRSDKDAQETRFYDRVGPDRLLQLIRTYQTVVDILTTIVNAELWNWLHEPGVNPKLLTFMKRVVRAEPTSTARWVRQGIRVLRLLQRFGPDTAYLLRVPELLTDSDWLPVLNRVSDYVEDLKKILGQMTTGQAVATCELTERQLTAFLTSVLFLVQYKLISVKNISLVKNRIMPDPQFVHRYYQYWETYLDPIFNQTLPGKAYLDSASVLFQRKARPDEPALPNDEYLTQSPYLNLTPFLIDQNAYQDKAILSDIFVWRSNRADGSELVYQPLLQFDGLKLTLMAVDMRSATLEQKQAAVLYHEMREQWNVLFAFPKRQS